MGIKVCSKKVDYNNYIKSTIDDDLTLYAIQDCALMEQLTTALDIADLRCEYTITKCGNINV